MKSMSGSLTWLLFRRLDRVSQADYTETWSAIAVRPALSSASGLREIQAFRPVRPCLSRASVSSPNAGKDCLIRLKGRENMKVGVAHTTKTR